MKLKFARTDSTVFVYQAETEAETEKAIAELIAKGEARHHPDGSREFIIDEEIVDTSKEGSEQYVWDKSGNRIKYNRCRYIVAADRTRTREIIRTVFKSWG